MIDFRPDSTPKTHGKQHGSKYQIRNGMKLSGSRTPHQNIHLISNLASNS